MNDSSALPFKGLSPFKHIHDNKGRYLHCPFRNRTHASAPFIVMQIFICNPLIVH
jgi:hypothetical protein